jgi:hypothetical protein
MAFATIFNREVWIIVGSMAVGTGWNYLRGCRRVLLVTIATANVGFMGTALLG